MSFVSSDQPRGGPSAVYPDPNINSGLPARRDSNASSSSDPDPAVRKVVYNLYRGLLGNYNDRANDIISSLPAEQVSEDQGIGKQVESMIRQSAEIRGAGEGLSSSRSSSSMASLPAESGVATMIGGGPPPPPPPPPPMPNGSNMPAIKINSELNGNSSSRVNNAAGAGKHMPGGGAPFSYIPPAAIQNAMMTKDKKPFTYTPGGIDFLSEIRSPRMQRRISKNAADEGVVHHQQQQHPSTGASGSAQLSPQALMAMQPQMAVPVFPPMPQQMPVLHSPTISSPSAGVSPQQQSHHHYEPPTPPPVTNSNLRAQLKPAVPNFNPPQQHYHLENDESGALQEVINSLPAPNRIQSSTPVINPSVPTPFVERRNAQLGTIYIPPVTGSSSPSSVTSPAASQVAKTPMPWMNSQNRTPSSPTPPFVQQLQQERVVIPLTTMASVIDPCRFDDVKPRDSPSSAIRVIPIAVEGRSAAPPTPQRSTAPVRSDEVHPPWHSTQQKVIPIHLEATPARTQQSEAPWRTQAAANANQIASMMEELMMSPTSTASSGGRHGGDPPAAAIATLNRSISTVQSQQPGQPTQSRSFRILQMITDTVHDPSSQQDDQEGAGESGRLSRSSVGSNNSGGGRVVQQPPGERRLNLTQEDRELMDMFRSQVNEEQSLHQESDPRYRGSHIPSRAFRILQNFTAESDDNGQHAGAIPVHRPQVAPINHQAPAQQQVRAPPSEQSEPEPRKYMGGNIPSRSFRMLQAMTASDPNDGQSDL